MTYDWQHTVTVTINVTGDLPQPAATQEWVEDLLRAHADRLVVRVESSAPVALRDTAGTLLG